MLVVGLCACVLAVTLAACVLIGWFAVARKAQQTAELAALAGVSAAVRGADACTAAASAAARNAATMTGCEVRGTEPWVVVEVEVSARLVGSIPGAPERVTRRATAGTLG
ncbi:hypothetical protein [Tessaracoccus lacteus]|uniref:Flp pilus-assembly TadG-like N-terminal domain-containing protein n=1 Tax=Tessaracoccus lacteus TaxID=3041766 RepID=A0ABY8PZ14_9ACTN|nr:hypothetical protein [Tessaracoccus sp. T21]WGT47637.1 hypothetical protein QH948_02330 [Tessaracoccus sp. T21]